MPPQTPEPEPIPVPLGMHDEAEFRSIRPARWQGIFSALRLDMAVVPPGPEAGEADEHGPALRCIAFYVRQSLDLQRIVSVALTIRDDHARDVLQSTAQRMGVDPAVNVPPADEVIGECPSEFATRFWLFAETDQLARRALNETLARLEVRADRIKECFRGKEARPVPQWTDAHRQVIENSLREHLGRQKVVRYVECTGFVDDEGALVLKIIHGEPTTAIPALEEGGRKVYRIQRERSDIIRYAPTGMLSVTCSKKSLIRHYLPLCGRVLFQDLEFFPEVPAIFLQVVLDQEAFQAARRDIDAIRDAVLTSVTVADDKGSCFTISNRAGVHRALRESGLLRSKVIKAEITLRMLGVGGDLDVNYIIKLEPPFRRKLDDASVHQPAAQFFLEELGVFDMPGFAGRNARDWFLFSPWRMSEAEWVVINEGKDIRPLLGAGLLHRIEMQEVDISSISGAPIPVVRLPTGGGMAVPADAALPPVPVSTTDLLGLEWDPLAQARAIAARLQLAGEPTLLFNKIVEVGSRTMGDVGYHLYLILSPVTEDELVAIRNRSTGRAIGLIPPGNRSQGAIDLITCRLPALDFPDLHVAIMRVTGLNRVVSALESAHHEDHFAVDLRTDTVWWVPTREVLDIDRLPEVARKFLLSLVRHTCPDGGIRTDSAISVAHPLIEADVAIENKTSHKSRDAFVLAMSQVIGEQAAKNDLIASARGVGFRLLARVHVRNHTVAAISQSRP